MICYKNMICYKRHIYIERCCSDITWDEAGYQASGRRGALAHACACHRGAQQHVINEKMNLTIVWKRHIYIHDTTKKYSRAHRQYKSSTR